MDFTHLKFDDQGLIPAVVQDWRDGTVLMLGFMNADALKKTLETKSVHFWSRSRNRLRSEEHTSELQSLTNLVCRLLLEKKKTRISSPATGPHNRLTRVDRTGIHTTYHT